MSRELKFRVWDKNENDMVRWELLNDGIIDLYHLFFAKDKNLIIQQFTGLLDSKGKEIYEGDILINTHPKLKKGVFFVKYNLCGFDAVYKGNFTLNLYTQLHHEIGECEVIGNIHETPELLQS